MSVKARHRDVARLSAMLRVRAARPLERHVAMYRAHLCHERRRSPVGQECCCIARHPIWHLVKDAGNSPAATRSSTAAARRAPRARALRAAFETRHVRIAAAIVERRIIRMTCSMWRDLLTTWRHAANASCATFSRPLAARTTTCAIRQSQRCRTPSILSKTNRVISADL